MSESQRRSHRGEIAFFKAPVVFGLGKSIGITGERLHNSFFKDVLSPVIDKTIMLNDSIQETAQSPELMINAKGGIHKKRLEWRIFTFPGPLACRPSELLIFTQNLTWFYCF